MTDLIRRADAIEAVMAEGRKVYTSECANAERIIYEADAVEALSMLPSAVCDDCIWTVCNYNKVDWDAPSADAEQVTSKLKNPCDSLLTGDSGECKEQKSKLESAEAVQGDGKMIPIELKKRYPHSRDEDITDAFMRGYKAHAEAVQGWIPCSERLPERGFGLHYLVTLKDGHDFMDDVYEAFFDKYGWHVGDNELAYDDIIAWMPLPTPYKGGDDE